MPLFEPDGPAFVPTGKSRGPWDHGALNGGPVAALLAHGVESHDGGGAARTGDQVVSRITVDLVRPVPLAPLTVETETLKPGRKVQVIQALLLAAGEVVSRAVAVRMPAAHPSVEMPVAPPPPGPEGIETRPNRRMELDLEFFHSDAVEMRQVRAEPGLQSLWIRLTTELLPGLQASPLVRAAAIADLPSGMTGMQSDGFRSINVDISLHLDRLPEGEWLHVDAVGHAWHGIGFADTALADERGRLGRVVQTCLVEPWRWPGRS